MHMCLTNKYRCETQRKEREREREQQIIYSIQYHHSSVYIGLFVYIMKKLIMLEPEQLLTFVHSSFCRIPVRSRM